MAAISVVIAGCSSGSKSGPTADPATPSPTVEVVSADDERVAAEGTEVEVVSEADIDEAVEEAAEQAEETAPPEIESITEADEPSLVNTTWSGTASDGYTDVLIFDAQGNVQWYENSRLISDLTWTRVGNDIEILAPSRKLTGTVTDGTLPLKGVASFSTFTNTLTKQ